jgi:hypothetical protein
MEDLLELLEDQTGSYMGQTTAGQVGQLTTTMQQHLFELVQESTAAAASTLQTLTGTYGWG